MTATLLSLQLHVRHAAAVGLLPTPSGPEGPVGGSNQKLTPLWP